jgi:hypothetical protein
MALKFQSGEGKIRLWSGVGRKQETPGIGIRFDKKINKKEVREIYKAVEFLLAFRYGKGTK